MSDPMLLTTREVAARLRCSERTAERLRLQGDGPPFVKFGATVRYPLDALDRWLAERVRHSTSEMASLPEARLRGPKAAA